MKKQVMGAISSTLVVLFCAALTAPVIGAAIENPQDVSQKTVIHQQEKKTEYREKNTPIFILPSQEYFDNELLEAQKIQERLNVMRVEAIRAKEKLAEKKRLQELAKKRADEKEAAKRAIAAKAKQESQKAKTLKATTTTKKVTTTTKKEPVTTQTKKYVSYSSFMVLGVLYQNGFRYTYYSQRVLPGGGLDIPGRHVEGGYVRDKDNYIVLASKYHKKGTVLDTPIGIGKVYDYCPTDKTIDVYVK